MFKDLQRYTAQLVHGVFSIPGITVRNRSSVVIVTLSGLLCLLYQIKHTWNRKSMTPDRDSVLRSLTVDANHVDRSPKGSLSQTKWDRRQSAANTLYPSINNSDAPSVRKSTVQSRQQQAGLDEADVRQSLYHPPWYHDIRNMDNPFTSTKPCTRDFNYSSMAEALAANASPDKVIILPSTVDGGYQHMALNFYEFNLKRLNITNFVFMCIDKEACDVLKNSCIPAYLFSVVAHGSKAFTYKDQEFVDKATTKLRIVRSALELGYHVLLTDLDIIYFKNPFNHFPCDDCDVQIQTNDVKGKRKLVNSGFMYIRNSPNITEAFGEMVRRHEKDPTLHDQGIVHATLKKNIKAQKLKVVNLPYDTWPAGMAYFGKERSEKRSFYDLSKPDDNVIVVHNNWITGIVAKTYRFKEHLMWVSDYNRYYSDPQRNYIMYDNPVKTDKAMEQSALSSAFGIASVLNRTVILPRFGQGTKPVSMFMDINTFEKKNIL